MNPKVDAYIARSDRWPDEMAALRAVLLGTGLTEELKWGKPCYCHDRANVAIVQEMRDFLALMFFKGALMDDPQDVLREQGQNSRSARRMEFASGDEIREGADTVRAYVAEAVRVEESGAQIGPAPRLELVAELRDRLDGDEDLRAAFERLTPGRRREYNMYFADAKKSSTRAARIEKHVARIMEGRGLRDR